MSSVFSEESFNKKLDHVTPTQDSVQSLALWIIHHKGNHEIIGKLWLRKLSDSSINTKTRLALFYLANDVIQTCKRKNARIFQETFRRLLTEAIPHVRVDSLKKNVERVIDVWAERNVYDKDFVAKLKQSLMKKDCLQTKSPTSNGDTPEDLAAKAVGSPPCSETLTTPDEKSDVEYQKIIEEFQPKKLCESINLFYNMQNETNLSKANVEATRLLDINVDHVKQYRDKTQCANFKTEFENSCLKLEDFLNKLYKESSERKLLIQLLEQSEIFYEAQFKDATTVTTAYKNYGTKVHTVKRKLEELLADTKQKASVVQSDAKLDNLDMEMSDDDNNETFNENKLSHGFSMAVDKHTKRFSRQDTLTTQSQSTRANLDPRQNRSGNAEHNKKHQEAPSFVGKNYQDSSKSKRSRISSDEDSLKLTNSDSPATPVRDEHSPLMSTDSPQKGHNPLDFLTKFINKSATNVTAPNVASKDSEPKSANLSYLVSSLKKFVNTGPGSGNNSQEASQPAALMSPSGFSNKYFDPNSSFQNSFIANEQPTAAAGQQRSGTPTKDETYPASNQPPLPPTSPQFINQAPPPPPAAPQSLQFHAMYQMQPPPPPMGMMNMMPPIPQPGASQLMIDPSYHQGYMYNQPPPQISPLGNSAGFQYTNQPNKMHISPGSNTSISPKSQGQLSSPNNAGSGYWMGPQGDYNPDQQNTPDSSLNELGNKSITSKTNTRPTNTDNFAVNVENTSNELNFHLKGYSNDAQGQFEGGADTFQSKKFVNNRGRGGYNGFNNGNKNQSYQNNFNSNNSRGNSRGGGGYHNNYNNGHKQSFNRIPTINSQRGDDGQVNQGHQGHLRGRGRGRFNNNRF